MPQDSRANLWGMQQVLQLLELKGDHNSGQSSALLQSASKMPSQKVEHSGGFKYARLKDPSEINDLLKKWNTPKEMKVTSIVYTLFAFTARSSSHEQRHGGKVEPMWEQEIKYVCQLDMWQG